MSVTMDDVARQAGVSKSTVSLVLNDRPGTSPEIQRIVRRAAESLGYALPRTRTVGSDHKLSLALVHCTLNRPLVDDGTTRLFLAYQRGIQSALHDRNANLTLIASYRDDEDDLGGRLLVRAEQFLAGLILMGPGLFPHSRIVQHARSAGVPLVVLGRNWAGEGISSVSQDHACQVQQALGWLAALGHTQIGFVAREQDRSSEWFRVRLATFHDWQAQQARDGAALTFVADDVPAAVANVLAHAAPPTALLALNDHVAQLTIAALLAAGRRVPEDLSVIGIDGIKPAQANQPALTTIAFPHEEVGRLAGQLLLQHIDNPHLAHAHIVVHSQLVEGASCRRLDAA